MRRDLCNTDICFPDGSINLKYFNVKKGHYWSKKENDKLIEGVINHGPTSFKQIKEMYLKEWTETEIRLRICKLLRYYNLKDYADQKFVSREQILAEAKKNKQEAAKIDNEAIGEIKKHMKTHGETEQVRPKDPKLVGGIFFNPPPLKEINKEYEGGANIFTTGFKIQSAKDEHVKDEEMKDAKH